MRSATLLFVALLPATLLSADPTVALRQPWRQPYQGDDATGKHVVALWRFDEGAELADSSGNGHTASLQGAKWHADGRFGACLETFPGWPVEDERHRALVADAPALTPPGAFTIELWICPSDPLDADYPDSFLIDKKYVAHHDYQLILGSADKQGRRTLRAVLGFGNDSATFHSEPAEYAPGTWRHVAMTYDGRGNVAFLLDGRPSGGGTAPGRGAVMAGRHPLSIGDRIGSYYHGFPGHIDQVRICQGVLEFRSVGLEVVSDRSCFVRMEPAAAVTLRVTNLLRQPIAGARFDVSLNGLEPLRRELTDMQPGASVDVAVPLDTSLRPDVYALAAEIHVEQPEPYDARQRHSVEIVPRRPPGQFPVLMWGVYGGIDRELDRLKRIGFTHVLGLGANTQRIFQAGEPTSPDKPETIAANKRMLDRALSEGITVAAHLAPAAHMRTNAAFQRVNREGKPVASRPDVCALQPEMLKLSFNVGASVAREYGHFPALGAALVHTEVRDHARPCFHPLDLAAFRQYAGFDVPAQVGGPRGVDWRKLNDFPTDRVIADDHPLYVYYRWYWKQGDGWNGLNTQLHRGLKSTGRNDLWTFHDPAVRVASVYGSGGEVDVLSQWTYSYPDPIRIGLATDELLAMTVPHPQQHVMKMTQIIWYRSQTAPPPNEDKELLPYQARWEREQPDAPFITIPPAHLREAFWTKIARPIRGIMYHGWQSLVPCDGPGAYRFTHPETQHELARLIRDVVRPLGPTLLEVPAATNDVALLESFASEMFARRGTFGWCGSWAGDVHHVLTYAHLQADIVFDETIVDHGLDGYRVLVMPDCDVITETMRERIVAFQQRGGIIVGDDRLTPAITPDFVLPAYQRTGKAADDKAALVRIAQQLRKQLDELYQRRVDTSSVDVIPYRRRFGSTDYVFLINDRREAGRYVGHHGIVMEHGLPSEAAVTVRRTDGAVYDLRAHRQLPARRVDEHLEVDVQLGPCDGALLMVTPRPIAGLAVEGPEQARRGERVDVSIVVHDAGGRPLPAVIPLEVRVIDPEGRLAEWSGAWAAVDGRLTLPLEIAANDPFGVWQIDVRELASGARGRHYLRVAGPAPWPPQRESLPDDIANPVQPKG